uniref:Uncharacterized protein n=1 Tax=Oryza meridionalis TaxID=40149 RepID=A0A0E0DEP1_9ORYZ
MQWMMGGLAMATPAKCARRRDDGGGDAAAVATTTWSDGSSSSGGSPSLPASQHCVLAGEQFLRRCLQQQQGIDGDYGRPRNSMAFLALSTAITARN